MRQRMITPLFKTRIYAVEPLDRRLLLANGTIHLDPHLRTELRRGEEGEEGEEVPVQGGPVDPYAPPLGGTIEAINFDAQASSSGFYNIPPDNSAAAGPSHVVNVVNTVIQWFTKAGTLQNTQRFGNNG